jgi:hypothetical protein
VYTLDVRHPESVKVARGLQLTTDPGANCDREQILTALNLSAEAQSLLFTAVIDTSNTRSDADQIQLYVTVRELAAARHTYIHRYLRREDRVDPRTYPDLHRRITQALELLSEFRKKPPNVKKALSNLRYKLKKAATDGAANYDEWPRVFELIDEAVTGGVATNSSELLEWLTPLANAIPQTPPPSAQVIAVIQELNRKLKDSAERSPHGTGQIEAAGAEVARAATSTTS